MRDMALVTLLGHGGEQGGLISGAPSLCVDRVVVARRQQISAD